MKNYFLRDNVSILDSLSVEKDEGSLESPKKDENDNSLNDARTFEKIIEDSTNNNTIEDENETKSPMIYNENENLKLEKVPEKNKELFEGKSKNK